MIKHFNFTVKGRVQGVWFRANTKEQAELLGITGYVKNLANDNVYIEAEGSSEQLALFELWCKQGPRLAHVTQLLKETGELQNYTKFNIR